MCCRASAKWRETTARSPFRSHWDFRGKPRGMPQIEVTFDIDANGIVNVSAKEKETGREKSIKIETSSGLSEEEIQKMVRDAEANAEADKKARELIDLKNQAEQMAYQTDKSLKEAGDKIDAGQRSKIEDSIKELRDAVAAEEADRLKDQLTKFQQAASDAAAAAAQAQQASGGSAQPDSGSSSSDGKKDGPVEVDYEVVDDKDK